ncbi:MAG: hypothetical protein ABIO70_16015 [Pseudomonadota bacterium]
MSAPPARAATFAEVRRTVRRLLEETPAWRHAGAGFKRRLAEKMVVAGMLAADQLAEEARITGEIHARKAAAPAPVRPPSILARAQSAGDEIGLQATREAGDTLRALREGIDFPNFVNNLLNGVFQAINNASIQQLEAVADLLDGVSASAAEFAAANITDQDAMNWAVGRFSFLRIVQQGDRSRLVVRDDEELGEHLEQIATALGASEDEVGSVSDDELNDTLLPLVKRKIGRSRQANLATLVLMGLNRIVVDAGQLHASMDMRVDTRSLAEQRKHARDEFGMTSSASANVGVGAWGASASMSVSVGRVRDTQDYTKEEVASQAGLRSSVDLTFHTEPLNLDQMISKEIRQSIISNSRGPQADWNQGNALTSGPILQPDSGSMPTPPVAPTPPAPQPTAPGTSATPTPPAGDTPTPPADDTPTPPAGGGSGGGGGGQGRTGDDRLRTAADAARGVLNMIPGMH